MGLGGDGVHDAVPYTGMFIGSSQTMNSIISAVPTTAWVFGFLILTLSWGFGGAYRRIERLSMVKVGLFALFRPSCSFPRRASILPSRGKASRCRFGASHPRVGLDILTLAREQRPSHAARLEGPSTACGCGGRDVRAGVTSTLKHREFAALIVSRRSETKRLPTENGADLRSIDKISDGCDDTLLVAPIADSAAELLLCCGVHPCMHFRAR